MAIRATMLMPSQKPEKLPATSPDRMFKDAPPSCEEMTTSLTWADSVEVKTLTSSGMTAPASVPHEIIEASFHHNVVSPPRSGTIVEEITYVTAIDTREVIQTSEVKGVSKFIFRALPYLAFAIAPLMKYAAALETNMAMRITKIHTSNCTCTVGSFTASKMKVISATPVTP